MEVILDELCGYLNNYFLYEPVPKHCHSGTFTVSNGTIQCDFLQDGQYFLITGSVFNNGVWKYPATDMTDEVFEGKICEMAVPKAIVNLLSEIEAWNAKYGTADSVNFSPFVSESFNNYSYSKGTRSNGGSSTSTSPLTWKDVFKDRFIRWKKVSL